MKTPGPFKWMTAVMILSLWVIGSGRIIYADTIVSGFNLETRCASIVPSEGNPSAEDTTADSDASGDEKKEEENFDSANRVWISEYLPLHPGNRWEYEGENSFYMQLFDTEIHNGSTTRLFYRQDLEETVYYVLDHNGLSRYKTKKTEKTICYNPDLAFLPAVAVVGTDYTNIAGVGACSGQEPPQETEQIFQTVSIVGFENISLPAAARINNEDYSTFSDCLKLDCSLTEAGETRTETLWLARYLGVVKIKNSRGVFFLARADMYYHTGLFGTWTETIYSEAGLEIGEMTLSLTQTGSTVAGELDLEMKDGETWNLTIREGLAIGPTLSGSASKDVKRLRFALTHNGYHVTGPYDSNFIGQGLIAPGLSQGNTAGFNEFGDTSCFVDSLVR